MQANSWNVEIMLFLSLKRFYGTLQKLSRYIKAGYIYFNIFYVNEGHHGELIFSELKFKFETALKKMRQFIGHN